MSGEDEDRPTLTVARGESVYDFIVFLPALQHKGEFAWDMKLGCLLMMINLAMQVGMTYIVGTGVLEDSAAWRTELVAVEVEDQYQVMGKEDTELGAIAFLSGAENVWSGKLWAEHVDDNDMISQMNVNGQEAFLQGHMTYSNHHKKGRKPKAGGKGGAAAAAGGSDDGGGSAGLATLCQMNKKNVSYSCLPPSVRFSMYWNRLDTNGDGIWTMEEAKEDKGKLQKKINVKPPQLFRAIVMGLTDRADDELWVPDEMKKLQEIPKAYFDYWAGDAALCAHADVKMCSSLVAKGIFTKALDPTIPGKGIHDINTAMDYCTFMLKPGGGCDQSLPQIYRLYRERRAGNCGKMQLYPGGVYQNPYNEGDKMYVIGVAYSALAGFIKTETMIFKVFMFLILLLWFFALLTEMRELLKLCEFLYRFPTCRDVSDGTEDLPEDKVKIIALTSGHKRIVAAMTIFRICLVIYIGQIGAVFLINDVGYMDLLMNAVALAFIIEIDELLYGAMARGGMCDAMENLEDLEFPTYLPTEGFAGWILMKDFWGLVVFPIGAVCVIMYHCHFTVDAVLDALNCACYQAGDQCSDARYFDQDFWDGYWTQVLPGALEKMAALKAGSN